jgi:putative intracellular protease/amidase
MPRIIMVTTSHGELGDTGRRTGLWLEELATPYYALLDGGAEITVASVKGGEVPTDPRSVGEDNPASVRRFLSDEHAMALLRAAPSIEEVDVMAYDAIFLPGGHGTMWDLPENVTLAAAVGNAFDNGRLVASVCHGPSGLVAARRADGNPVVQGKRVSAFTDSEEAAEGLTQVVPFLLETRLRALGALFERAPDFQPFAVRDGNLITGQNPASADEVAKLVLQALSERTPASAGHRPPVVATPAGSVPVVVTLRLAAVDPDALKAHLQEVIPATRLASGCRYSHCCQGTTMAHEFLLVQGWDSIEQQQAYIGWRMERGDLAKLRALLSGEPVVESFAPFEA